MKIECKKCGILDTIIIDGYDFGDTLLEGVSFKVTVDESDNITIKICKEDKEYFSTLNTKHWLDKCLEFVEESIEQYGELEGECFCGRELILIG